MTRVSERVMDAAGRAAVLSPRDGVVLETGENLSDDGARTTFRQAEGPSLSTAAPSRSRRWRTAGTEFDKWSS